MSNPVITCGRAHLMDFTRAAELWLSHPRTLHAIETVILPEYREFLVALKYIEDPHIFYNKVLEANMHTGVCAYAANHPNPDIRIMDPMKVFTRVDPNLFYIDMTVQGLYVRYGNLEDDPAVKKRYIEAFIGTISSRIEYMEYLMYNLKLYNTNTHEEIHN